MLVLAPALVLPALGASAAPDAAAAAEVAAETPPKVVIVVGATHGSTASYRSYGDLFYAEAIKHTSNVVKVYSPNASWSQVKAAAQGASILIYLGHGSGYPKTSSSVFDPNNHDGMGLNTATNPSDNVAKYYGENYMANDIRLAKNAVVILSHLCYASGNSESGDPEPSYAVARQRIDNFASGFLRAGARAVIADVWNSAVVSHIKSFFTTDQTIGNMWANSVSNHGHQMPFTPSRNPAYKAIMDPNTWTSGFYRSIVGALDMRTTAVVNGAGAAPTGTDPAVGPRLWSMDGPTTISPNYDGVVDQLNLVARFSETATWNVSIRNAGGDEVRSQSGTGHQAFITWDVMAGSELAPEGSYTWTLHATDAAATDPLDETGAFEVIYQPTPQTGVLSFTPGSTVTTSSTINYALAFAGPVSGLTKGDFRISGSASGCVLGAPAGGPTSYTIQVTSCSSGTVTLKLNPGSVTDTASNVGPNGEISATKVTIDRTAPAVGTVKARLRTGVTLASNATNASLPMTVSWSATDAGSGVKSYDVKRSYDGGAYERIASAITTASLSSTVKPGHTYRFKVRARDKAGNVSSWVASSTWHASLTQQTTSAVKYTGTWSSESVSAFSAGSARYATAASASASYSFSGRSVGWVTRLAPTSGAVQVYVDGVLAATIDTTAASTSERVVAYSRSWSGYGAHTIKLVVVGTTDRPRADLDAFAVIR
jgi:hypothetical protein